MKMLLRIIGLLMITLAAIIILISQERTWARDISTMLLFIGSFIVFSIHGNGDFRTPISRSLGLLSLLISFVIMAILMFFGRNDNIQKTCAVLGIILIFSSLTMVFIRKYDQRKQK